MYKKILFLVVLCLSIYTNAQDKLAIGILHFTFKDAVLMDNNRALKIQQKVTDAFVQTKRFKVVDRSIMDAVSKEKELQKSEDFIDGTITEQGKAIGARYLISGFISNTYTNAYASANSLTGVTEYTYVGIIEIQLKVVDVETGETVCSESLVLNSHNAIVAAIAGGVKSPVYAINKAIYDASSEIDKFVGRNFPVSFLIADIQQKDSRDRICKVLISGGSEFGLRKGDKLFIFDITYLEISGKKVERKREIGELKILEVEGANFSICTVKSGAEILTKRMAENGNLVITTKN